MNEKKYLRFSISDVVIVSIIFLILTSIRFAAEVIDPLWFPLLLAYAFIPLIIVKKVNWKDIGLKKPKNSRYILIGVVLSVLIKAVTIIALFGLFKGGPLNWMNGILEHYKSIPDMPAGIIVVVLLFTIGVPVAEEIFFRMFQTVWGRKFGLIKGLIISAFLFGLSHIDQYIYPFNISGVLSRLVPIFIYGLVHAWVFYKTESTYGSIISHLAGNAVEAYILLQFFI